MPVAHPPVPVVPGDAYIHQFELINEDGTPADLTGMNYSAIVTVGGVESELAASATVLAPATNGIVRVEILDTKTTELFAGPRKTVRVRLRNDTSKTSLLAWELGEEV